MEKMRPLWIVPSVLSVMLSAGCSPKPPPPAATSPASGAPAASTPSETAAAQAEASGGASAPPPTEGTIRAVSRGTARQPARYIVRDKTGAIVYDINSSTVTYDRASDGTAVASFTNPQVTFHTRSRRTVVADSPKAVAHDRDKSVVMTGGVHAKTDDGKMLTCAKLTYDARNQRILCEGDVVLRNTATNQTASGDRLLTDPDFDHVVLSGSR